MGRKSKRNARVMRAITEIKRMQRSSGRAIKKMKDLKGRNTEKIGEDVVISLLSKGLIKYKIRAERWSFMDVVLKTDYVIGRLSDGMPIPVQIKSSLVSQTEKEKYKFFVKKYGDLPVFMSITLGDNDLKKLEDLFLRKINSWKGSFSCNEWQFKYSKFFDFIGHPGFGVLRKRINIFFSEKRRKERWFFEQQKEKSKNEIALKPQFT